MSRIFVLFIIFVFFVITPLYIYFRIDEKPYLYSNKEIVQKTLQNAPFKTRLFFSYALKEAFITSSIGYTLFGDKPLSAIVIPTIPHCINGSYFINPASLLARKYEKILQGPNFALFIEEEGATSFLYIINKKAFRDVVSENIQIFQNVLGKNISSKTLLHSILSKTKPLHLLLKNNSALLGILYGFGIKNALNFDRREEIESDIKRRGFPPWKDPNNFSTMNYKDIVLFNMEKAFLHKHQNQENFPKNISPISGFSSLQEELVDLNKKLTFPEGHENPPGIFTSVTLPQFCGDPTDEETQKIVEKYKIQRFFLENLLTREDFLEKVFEKFYEDKKGILDESPE